MVSSVRRSPSFVNLPSSSCWCCWRYPHNDNRLGVYVQSELEGFEFCARDLLRAHFRVIQCLLGHSVGGCSALALPRQLLMSSTNNL